MLLGMGNNMGRKKVADMTPDELEAHRDYMRKAKAKSRAGKPPEKDNRTNRQRDRTPYMREYRRKEKDESNPAD